MSSGDRRSGGVFVWLNEAPLVMNQKGGPGVIIQGFSMIRDCDRRGEAVQGKENNEQRPSCCTYNKGDGVPVMYNTDCEI